MKSIIYSVLFGTIALQSLSIEPPTKRQKITDVGEPSDSDWEILSRILPPIERQPDLNTIPAVAPERVVRPLCVNLDAPQQKSFLHKVLQDGHRDGLLVNQLRLYSLSTEDMDLLYHYHRLLNSLAVFTLKNPENLNDIIGTLAKSPLNTRFTSLTIDKSQYTDQSRLTPETWLPWFPNLLRIDLKLPRETPVLALSKLYDLQHLNLEFDRPLTHFDIFILANFVKLRHLSIESQSSEGYFDFTLLKNIPELESLRLINLGHFDYTQLSVLTNLTNLTLTHHKAIMDLDNLAFVTGLSNLTIVCSTVKSLNFLGTCTRLRALGLVLEGESVLKDVPLVTSLTSLKFSTQSDDLGLLTSFPNLEVASISSQTTDAKSFVGLTNLRQLKLVTPRLVKLDPLRALSSLEYLSIEAPKVRTIRFVERLFSLNHLELLTAGLKDLEPLRYTKALKIFVMNFVPQIDLSAISSLRFLKTLVLRSNNEMALNSIESLPTLQVFRFSAPYSQQIDITELSARYPKAKIEREKPGNTKYPKQIVPLLFF